MKKRIVVVGSINLDLVASVERMPTLGETISGREFHTFCGGKGANQAVAAARLGAPVAMVARLGNDHFGSYLRSNLADAGVDTAYVESVRGSSGTALIATTPKGENLIIVIPGANGKLLPDDLEACKDELRNAAIILAQLESPLPTVEHLVGLAKSFGVPLMLDPAPAQPLQEQVLRAVTWFTPNESETRSFLGDAQLQVDSASAPKVAEMVLQLGVRNVILKLGAKGVYMAGQERHAAVLARLPGGRGGHHRGGRRFQRCVCVRARGSQVGPTQGGGVCLCRGRNLRDQTWSADFHAQAARGRSVSTSTRKRPLVTLVRDLEDF